MRMITTALQGLVLTVLAMATLMGSVQAENTKLYKADARLDVNIHDNLISVNADRVPMRDVLKKISESCELTLYSHDPLAEPISITFSALPFQQGMHRILSGYNFTMEYRSGSPKSTESPDLPILRIWIFDDRSDTAFSELQDKTDQNSTPSADESNTDSQYQTIESLKADLTHPDQTYRLLALHNVSQFNDPNVLELVYPLLNDQSPKVRERAIETLGVLNGVPPVRFVETLITDEAANVREAAIESVGDTGDIDSINSLITALHYPDPRVQQQAVYEMINIDAQTAVRSFSQIWHFAEKPVRIAIIKEIPDMEEVISMDLLAMAMSDEDPEIRLYAVYAAEDSGYNSAIPLMKAALLDSEESVRNAASEALSDPDSN